LSFNALHSVLSQKIELSKTTTMMTSNQILCCVCVRMAQLVKWLAWTANWGLISNGNKD
jgi:hypothetical protein